MADIDSDDFVDREMREYKLRTAYGGLLKKPRHKPSKYNHVQVAHSDGCCSSADSTNRHPHKHTHTHTPRHEAHDRAHQKLDPVYVQRGRVTKPSNRPKKPNTPPYSTGQSTSMKSPPATEKKGCCCCCTIC
ncbi:unnamed protein product [Adineta ricciae]|uniref:Uncharacterized protein n=1 Tax=Adineta ricciae TaxID=249248 RepID=A0A814KUW7_ADIRI|nr:unnamed protein product [Adineta ricciae]